MQGREGFLWRGEMKNKRILMENNEGFSWKNGLNSYRREGRILIGREGWILIEEREGFWWKRGMDSRSEKD